jgi:hypothetical protein
MLKSGFGYGNPAVPPKQKADRMRRKGEENHYMAAVHASGAAGPKSRPGLC